MCGIAGIFYLNGRAIEPELIYKMSSTMKHRGPDSQAYAFFPLEGKKFIVTEHEESQLPFTCSLGLAHLRLAILDLSSKAHQPMSNEDQSLWLIFNGEIYNYKELRTELKAAGHQFRSKSDAEVILHAYEEWGMECLKRFNGMWAFALWDSTKGSLILSRDRFGIKPFYYLYRDNKFIFASEIKAILKICPDERQPNYQSIHHFLSTGMHDDSQQTFFKNIQQLLPATCLKISSQGSKQWKYWQLEKAEDNFSIEENPYEQFLYLLKDAVRLRLQSDVPVGTCLSGGLDSSSIVCLATEIVQQPMHTFSSIYEEEAYNESFFANLIINQCKTKSLFINPKTDDFFETLSKIIWHQDEPTYASGIYSQWHVMKLAAGNVKVLLDGQGGDEILGGYHSFFLPYLADYVRHSLSPKNWIKLAQLLTEIRSIKALSNQILPKLLLALISPQLVHGVEKFVDKKRAAINPEFEKSFSKGRYYPSIKKPFKSKLNNWLYHTLTQASIPALLHYEDRNSMAFSIESRTPFLDYRLVEFMFQLPFDYKIKNGMTKYILRKALEGILPPEIVNRKDKKGFPTPDALWFRGKLKDEVRDLLASSSFKNREILDRKKALHVFEKHCQGKMDYSWYIWRWINLELWFREFIDKT
jgi:asparagine synthase (glutamine-hydrolysing)